MFKALFGLLGNLKISYFIVLLGFVAVSLYLIFSTSRGLYFVDSGRYADVARNLFENGQMQHKFVFPSYELGKEIWVNNLPPLHIYVINLFFHVFGVNDQAVLFESIFFFLLSTISLFFLAKRLFNQQIGLMSALFYLFTPELFNYAKDGASEPIFIFELLVISYLILHKSRIGILLAGVISAAVLFTKLQAYLFIPIFGLWIVLLYPKQLYKLAIFLIAPAVPLITQLFGYHMFNYVFNVPFYIGLQQTTAFPGDDLPRSGNASRLGADFLLANIKVFISKIFYNLYNFYKIVFTFTNSLPSYVSPLLVVSYVFSQFTFFVPEKRDVRLFRLIVLIMLLGSFLLAAATSPSLRYAHPVIPFLIILAVEFLYQMYSKIGFNNIQTNGVVMVTIVMFMIIPFLGKSVLDERFNSKAFNINHNYAHKALGIKLGQVTQNNDVIVTNLDTWGSWYGDRKTIMIPVDINTFNGLDKAIKVDTLFLTDFQRFNEDHPLTGEWGDIFDNQAKLLSQFELVESGVINGADVYENQNYSYQVWKRK